MKKGLLIVDEVVGFCSVGGGNMAPQTPNSQIAKMVDETVTLARQFMDESLPIMAFRDTHEPNTPEFPYPEHCVRGTGEEELVPDLKFIEGYATTLDKDCINGFVGAITANGNAVIDWLVTNRIKKLVVIGICSDICVLDFVVTIMSVMNHRIDGKPMTELKEVLVYEPATATYDLNMNDIEANNLPLDLLHEQKFQHMIGLSVMKARGAKIAYTKDEIDW